MQTLKRIATGFLVALFILTTVGPALVYAANASISLSVNIGPPGTSVTVASSNFAASETSIVVFFDNTPVTTPTTANATGGWNATFTVPATPGGTHAITARGDVTLTGNVTPFPFTVTPVITLNRTTGPTGTSVTVSGAGFGANETGVSLTYATTTASQATVASGILADAKGSWTANFVVPASSGGAHTIDAAGSLTPAASVPDASFSVTPALSVSKTSGAAGGSLTVTGTGFGASENGITVTYDGVAIASGINANAQGGWTATFNVPASQAGSHSIDASGPVTATGAVASAAFSVTPSISVSKAAGASGSSVTVTGSSFVAGETGISVTYDGTAVASGIAADAQGAWTAAFVVPASAAGAHTIDASGPATQAAAVGDAVFTVTASISLSKASGPGGTPVTVTGSGFGASEGGISVTYDGAAAASGITANPQGGWSATFAVPASPAGPHVIDASGPATQAAGIADATFTVSPSISISKGSGSAGGSVTVTGSGFGAGETGISVTYDGKTMASDIAANSRGGWTATFVVPPSAAGSHSISAAGPVTQSTAVSETGFVVGAGISITPAEGHVGADVEIDGSGFNANSPLKITYDGRDVVSDRLSADAAGSFTRSITIPKSQAGSHTVKVIDGEGHSAQATFNISDAAPSAPALLSPADGARASIMGDATPNLKWAEVIDPSGVTYTVQIAAFADFSPVILEKRGISGTHYALTSSEALPRGSYYWRVKATNGASVDGEWSEARLVRSGLISPAVLLVTIPLIAAAGLGAWFAVIRPRTARRLAAVAQQPAPSQVVQGEWRVVESEEDGGPRRLPWRLALPEAPKRGRSISTEDQARLKVALDFARSLPLVEPGYDVGWLVDLARPDSDEPSARAGERILRGELLPRYEPAWMNHPIYQDLLALLEGQPILRDLETYVGSVGNCASEAVLLFQDIYGNASAEAGADILGGGGFAFVSAVYSDAMNWFLGRALRDPSERDYVLRAEDGDSPQQSTYLCGAENSSFAGKLIRVADENDAARLRSLHIKLRRMYRNDERTRRLTSVITQIGVQRNRLVGAFTQLGASGNSLME